MRFDKEGAFQANCSKSYGDGESDNVYKGSTKGSLTYSSSDKGNYSYRIPFKKPLKKEYVDLLKIISICLLKAPSRLIARISQMRNFSKTPLDEFQPEHKAI